MLDFFFSVFALGFFLLELRLQGNKKNVHNYFIIILFPFCQLSTQYSVEKMISPCIYFQQPALQYIFGIYSVSAVD